MLSYLIKRLVLMVPVLVGVSFLTFALMRIIPGDIVTNMMGVSASNNPETRARVLQELGLDKPLLEQYVWWLGRILRGDFGHSFVHGGPVLTEILRCLPVTFELCLIAMLSAIFFGVPLGVFAGVYSGKLPDTVARLYALLGISAPGFFIGTLIVVLGAKYFPGVPTLGYVPFLEDPMANLVRIIWPSVTLGIGVGAILLRYTRGSVIDVLSEDYVRTAEAKGLPFFQVVYKHAVRNALIPVITAAGVWTAYLLGSSVLVEEVFAVPGLGRLVLSSIQNRDYPMIQAAVIFMSIGICTIILITDILVSFADPRVKLQ